MTDERPTTTRTRYAPRPSDADATTQGQPDAGRPGASERPQDAEGNPWLRDGADAPDAADIEDPATQQ